MMPTRDHIVRGGRRLGVTIVVGIAVLFTSVPPCAAGEVSGLVSFADKKDPFPPGGILTLSDERNQRIEVRTDGHGKYHIFLASGRYRVTFRDAGGTWRAEIQSYPGPLIQDIVLVKD